MKEKYKEMPYIIITALLLLTSLKPSNNMKEKNNTLENLPLMKNPVSIAGKALKRAGERIKNEYGAFPIGIGMGGNITALSLELEINKNINLDEVRSLLLGCRKILSDEINSSEDLRQFLDPYPFTNANITIFVNKEDGTRNEDPQICAAYTFKGSVTLLTNDPEDEFKYKNTFKETLEEAEEKNQAYLKSLKTN